MSTEIDLQQFGRLQAQVETLIASDKRKAELLQTMSDSISAIQLQLAEAKGGWRLLVALGGMSATLGSAITWVVHEWLKRG